MPRLVIRSPQHYFISLQFLLPDYIAGRDGETGSWVSFLFLEEQCPWEVGTCPVLSSWLCAAQVLRDMVPFDFTERN